MVCLYFHTVFLQRILIPFHSNYPQRKERTKKKWRKKKKKKKKPKKQNQSKNYLHLIHTYTFIFLYYLYDIRFSYIRKYDYQHN